MKITVTNDSTDRSLLVTRRADGIRTQDEPIAPLQAREFLFDQPNTQLSFAEGPPAENAAAEMAPPVDQGDGNGAQAAGNSSARSWNETRAMAIKLGAPKNVTKAEAETLIAENEAAALVKTAAEDAAA
jgi:hypothetical protein